MNKTPIGYITSKIIYPRKADNRKDRGRVLSWIRKNPKKYIQIRASVLKELKNRGSYISPNAKSLSILLNSACRTLILRNFL